MEVITSRQHVGERRVEDGDYLGMIETSIQVPQLSPLDAL
jgi:hypothetical protein